METTYIKWLIIFLSSPLLLLWIINFKLLWRYKRTIAFCICWALIFSIPWDYWAIQTKIWLFPQDTNIGLLLGGIPLEEFIFYVLATVFVSSITILVKQYGRRSLVD